MNRFPLSIINSPLSISIVLTLLLSASSIHAQQILLHFPHFAGHQYEWQIFQGKDPVTALSGQIPPDGRVTLTMPEAYQDYRGMTRWLLKKGGGLDMIYLGKGFSVECLAEQPGPDNIIYTGNPENDYLKAQHTRQQTILDKLGAINHLLQIYAPDETLHKTALAEQAHLRQAFEQAQADRKASPLYAARFGEIVDFTRGIADRIYENPEDHTAYFNEFVTHTLDFKDLYTSGHWDQVLHHWVMMNLRSRDGETDFAQRLITALGRMDSDRLLAAFARNTVPLLVQQGKDDLLPEIKIALENRPQAMAGVSGTIKTMLDSFVVLTGTKGPDLVFQAPVHTKTGIVHQDVILETDRLEADYTVLLFFNGDCPLCEDALIDLANRYQDLKQNNVRVIAVSTDENVRGFTHKKQYHQWPDLYCDLTGMAGVNVKNYAVLGIPTLFLLDANGIVLKKSARVDDVVDGIDDGVAKQCNAIF
jgi:peroxiredoxin